MKGIFKFMTVALAAGLVVSCSDDLGLDQAGKYAPGLQEGVGTIVQFDADLATRLAAKDDGGVGRPATSDFVWKKGEQVRVFTLDKLAQDIFQVATGDGTNTATFTQVVDAKLPIDSKKYAVTESEMIYGISAEPNANADGETLPLLTLTIPSGRDILDSDGDGNDFDIVNAWKPGEVAARVTEGGKQFQFRNFPIPFWGAAVLSGSKIDGDYYTEDVKLTTAVQSLTAALRINLKSLPAGTKYIVLTTHGGQPFRDEVGYILADKISGNKDAYETWYKDKVTEEPVNKDWVVTDGWSEPIAGTMRAILDPDYTYAAGADDANWPKLAPDPRLVPSDEMIIDIQGLTSDKIIYVPILCQFKEGTNEITGEKYCEYVPYKNLHVIAAKQISEKWRYCYEGVELRHYQDQIFKVNKLYNLDMGLVSVEKAHLDELNDLIKNNCKDKDITTVINVGTFYAYNYDSWRNDTAIYVNVPGNVQLNLEKIVTCRRGKNFANPLTVTDKILPAHSNRYTEDRVREVEINVPNTWFKLAVSREEEIYNGGRFATNEGLSSSTPNYLKASKLNVVCGQSDVILGSVDGNKNSLVAVNVLASKTKFNTKPELLAANVTFDQGIDPEEKAAVKVKHGFGRVNLVCTEDGRKQKDDIGNDVPGTKGSVYIYTPALSQFETEVDTLDIMTNAGNYIRLDDALVYNLHFSEYATESYREVATVGSSAIGYIYDGRWNKKTLEYGANKEHFDDAKGDWTPYEPIDEDVVNEDDQWYKPNTGVSGVNLRAFWTGKALSVRAINAERGLYSELTYDSPVDPVYPTRSYDVRTIWTAAQLASVGEGVYVESLERSNHDYATGDLSKEVAPKVAVYNIPVALLKTFWLGGWEYFPYRWIGARARVNGFKLNGEGTELRNMSMLPYWLDNGEEVVVDPHWCCTSCWRDDIPDRGKLYIKQDVGLIRYIQNGDIATVFNVHLNDPLLIMNPNDQNYCGFNYTDKKYIEPFRIDNVGAIVGRISTKEVHAYDNMVGEVKIDMMFEKGGKLDGARNVGGMIGFTQIGWTAETEHAFADLDGNWYNTGVKVGYGPLDMHGNQVWGQENHPSGFIVGYEFVGGLSGKIVQPTTADIIKNLVNLKMENPRRNIKQPIDMINLWSFNGHVGGLAGYFNSSDATKVNQNKVDCAEKIEATGGMYYGDYQGSWAGGLFGRAINVSAGDLELIANLVRAKSIIAGKSYVGGLIGDLNWDKDIVTVDDSKSFYNNNATVKSDYYMVDVADSIYCRKLSAGGIFGRINLGAYDKNYEYIMAAQVKVPVLQADDSWAGGLVGEVESGWSYVGDEKFALASRDRGVIVEVGKMATTRGAGGLFGTNGGMEGHSHIYINDGLGNWNSQLGRNFRTYTFIEVKDWALTAKPSLDQYFGTFSNVLGHMGDVLYLNNDITTEAELGTPSLFFVNDYLDSKKKLEVRYDLHPDNNHTAGLEQWYWGDKNGYVGWRSNQKYYIGGKDPDHQVAFEQISSWTLPTANRFRQHHTLAGNPWPVADYAEPSKLIDYVFDYPTWGIHHIDKIYVEGEEFDWPVAKYPTLTGWFTR